MSQNNKALVGRYIDELNQNNTGIIQELFAADGKVYSAAGGELGREAFRGFVATLHGAFPDFRWTTEDIITEGDKAVFRWTFRGTHEGEFRDIAPTNKQIAYGGISIVRIANGKFVEGWAYGDTLGLLQQLGAIPP